MGFDLSTLTPNADQGAVMTVLNPITMQPLRDDAGDDVTITLAGEDSEVYRSAQRAATNKRLAMRGKGKITAEELEAEALELLARCTLQWSGIVWEGKALECNAKHARMLYQALPWLREQVDAFIADRSHFLTSSSAT